MEIKRMEHNERVSEYSGLNIYRLDKICNNLSAGNHLKKGGISAPDSVKIITAVMAAENIKDASDCVDKYGSLTATAKTICGLSTPGDYWYFGPTLSRIIDDEKAACLVTELTIYRDNPQVVIKWVDSQTGESKGKENSVTFELPESDRYHKKFSVCAKLEGCVLAQISTDLKARKENDFKWGIDQL